MAAAVDEAASLTKELEEGRLNENRREKRRSHVEGDAIREAMVELLLVSLPEIFLSSSRLRLRHLLRIDLVVNSARKLVARLCPAVN